MVCCKKIVNNLSINEAPGKMEILRAVSKIIHVISYIPTSTCIFLEELESSQLDFEFDHRYFPLRKTLVFSQK